MFNKKQRNIWQVWGTFGLRAKDFRSKFYRYSVPLTVGPIINITRKIKRNFTRVELRQVLESHPDLTQIYSFRLNPYVLKLKSLPDCRQRFCVACYQYILGKHLRMAIYRCPSYRVCSREVIKFTNPKLKSP